MEENKWLQLQFLSGSQEPLDLDVSLVLFRSNPGL